MRREFARGASEARRNFRKFLTVFYLSRIINNIKMMPTRRDLKTSDQVQVPRLPAGLRF
jgi:hypothetical protein